MSVNTRKRMAPTEAPGDRYAAPALEKGLDILELLSETDVGTTQRQIAESLGRSASEIFRMLMCLEQRGYILRTRPDDLYYLSARMFVLAHRHPPTRRLHDAALPILRRLANQTAQSCHLGVVHHGQLLIVVQVDAPGFMGFVIRPGTCMPLHLTGSGATLLAFQDESTRQQWLSESPQPLNAEARRALDQRLARIRRRGYEQQPSQTVRGITDISAPVFDHNHQAMAAVTIPYLASLDGSLTAPEVRRYTLDAATELSSHLGYNPTATP